MTKAQPSDGWGEPSRAKTSAGASRRWRADDDGDDVLTVSQAAALLKIGRNALYEACARNEVPHRRIGRQIRFSREALVQWLASWSKQGAQKGQ